MPKPKKSIRKMRKDRGEFERRTSPGSVRRGGRSTMRIVDQMSTGRRRRNQSTDSNQ